MRLRGILSSTTLLLCSAAAYEPPVDRAGPLTVQIERPAAGAYGAGGFIEMNQPGFRSASPCKSAARQPRRSAALCAWA